jgi:hypothetical protein
MLLELQDLGFVGDNLFTIESSLSRGGREFIVLPRVAVNFEHHDSALQLVVVDDHLNCASVIDAVCYTSAGVGPLVPISKPSYLPTGHPLFRAFQLFWAIHADRCDEGCGD